MATDKTVISIPSLYFNQYAPNLTKIIGGGLTYNEGIYLYQTESLNRTYRKSVVRVYKNPYYPKKIYLLSKDTSYKQVAAKAKSLTLDMKDYSTDDINDYLADSSYSQYITSDVDILKKYSKFTQPSNLQNLNFQDSSLNNKTINFYTLGLDVYQDKIYNNLAGPEISQVVEGSEDVITKNGLIFDSSEELLEIFDLSQTPTFGYLLKSKSMVTDYKNDSNTYSKLQTDLFNASLYYYWTRSGSIDKISYLLEDDLVLNKASTIVKTKAIDFNQYVDNKFDNLWFQYFNDEISSINGTVQNGNYTINSYYTPDNSWYNLQDNPSVGALDSEYLYSLKNLLGKDLFVVRPDQIIGSDLIKKQLFNIPETETFKTYTNIGTTQLVTGAFSQNSFAIFDSVEKLELSASSESDVDIYAFGNQTRIDQIENLTDSNKSTLYVLNNNWVYSSYGFIPDDPQSVIYEIELENELEIENGTFMVVEIE